MVTKKKTSKTRKKKTAKKTILNQKAESQNSGEGVIFSGTPTIHVDKLHMRLRNNNTALLIWTSLLPFGEKEECRMVTDLEHLKRVEQAIAAAISDFESDNKK